MEVVESRGVSVFVETSTIPKPMSWHSKSAPGVWFGVLLKGSLSVEQERFGCRSWAAGDGTLFSSDTEIDTLHHFTVPGQLAAVFVHVAPDATTDVLGETNVDFKNSHKILYPAQVTNLGWQIVGCPLQGSSRRLYMAGKGLEMAAQIMASRDMAPPLSGKYNARDIEIFHEARTIMMREVANPPSVQDLAMRLGINATKLGTGFRDLFGVPPYAFSKTYRLEQAKFLFEEGENSVSQVAAKLGYQPRHLSTEFRRKFGCTPSEVIRAQ